MIENPYRESNRLSTQFAIFFIQCPLSPAVSIIGRTKDATIGFTLGSHHAKLGQSNNLPVPSRCGPARWSGLRSMVQADESRAIAAIDRSDPREASHTHLIRPAATTGPERHIGDSDRHYLKTLYYLMKEKENRCEDIDELKA
jgi:hypothetical protein